MQTEEQVMSTHKPNTKTTAEAKTTSERNTYTIEEPGGRKQKQRRKNTKHERDEEQEQRNIKKDETHEKYDWKT